MTLSKTLAATFTLLALGTSVGANASEATAYRYGMHLDIAQVIKVDAPTASEGHASRATLTYRDSSGQLRSISYSQPTIASNQN